MLSLTIAWQMTVRLTVLAAVEALAAPCLQRKTARKDCFCKSFRLSSLTTGVKQIIMVLSRPEPRTNSSIRFRKALFRLSSVFLLSFLLILPIFIPGAAIGIPFEPPFVATTFSLLEVGSGSESSDRATLPMTSPWKLSRSSSSISSLLSFTIISSKNATDPSISVTTLTSMDRLLVFFTTTERTSGLNA